MRHSFTLSTAPVLCVGLAIICAASAQAASEDETTAKAMLEKVVAAVKADEAKALDTFNKGESGFYVKDHDIFPFCFTKADGKIVATQTKQAMGKDVRAFKDKRGKAFGQEIYDDAKDGKISQVEYTFGKPGAEQTPVPKVSFVTGVADLGCAVGYYK
jgi:hypothetical protein